MKDLYPNPAAPGNRSLRSLLLDESPLLVQPSLAMAVGLNEAIVLQQIHYWLMHNQADPKKYADDFREGRWWTYNTIEEWQEQFPFWSVATVERTLMNLRTKGVVLGKQFGKAAWDRTMWYSIDYESLAALPVPVRQSSAAKYGNREPQPADVEEGNLRASTASLCGDREPRLAIVDGRQTAGLDGGKLRQTLSETSPETLTKKTHRQQQKPAPPAPPEPPVVVAGDDPDAKKADEIFAGGDPVLAQVASPPALNPDSGSSPAPDPSPPEMLLAELVSEGLGEGHARMAVRDHYAAAVMQLANLRHALPGEKILPSRGGWLHLAITRGYGHTKGYAQYLSEQKAAEQRRAAQARREADRLARMEAERVNFDAIANDLTPEEDAALRQKARNCVPPEYRKGGEVRCAKLVQANYEMLLRGEGKKEYGFWAMHNATP